jgi:hypothetical protein
MSQEFLRALQFLNERIDSKYHIEFLSVDMKHEKKVRSQLGFIDLMYDTAETLINKTSLFSAEQKKSGMVYCSYQVGIIRTNCIDCIDRTNGAQMLICNKALERQLISMGLVKHLDKDCELYQLLNNLYEEMGDELAIQYSGSAAHKQISRSRGRKAIEIMTSIKRHWSNIVTDPSKQQSINLFLGVFDPRKQRTPLWEVEDDYYLHVHSDQNSAPSSHGWAQFAIKRFQHRLKIQLFPDEGVRSSKKAPNLHQYSQSKMSAAKPREKNRMAYASRDLLLYFPHMTSITFLMNKLAQRTSQVHRISIEFNPNFSTSDAKTSDAQESVKPSREPINLEVSEEEVKFYEDYLDLNKLKTELLQRPTAQELQEYESDPLKLMQRAEPLSEFLNLLKLNLEEDWTEVDEDLELYGKKDAAPEKMMLIENYVDFISAGPAKVEAEVRRVN